MRPNRRLLQGASLALALSIVLAACQSPLGGDNTPPGAAANLEATAEDGRVTLSWTEPAESDISLVRVSWSPGGTQALEIDPGAETATIDGLTNGTEYTFTVVTVDGAGNESEAITITATPFPLLASYTVSYEANGADSGTPPADQTKTEGSDLTLADNSGNLARTGFTFEGWNTASDGSGDSYAEGATYTDDADVTLYAKWTALPTYTVTYDANDADSGNAPNEQTKTHGTDLTLASNSGGLTQGGFTFAGWNTADDGSGTVYAEGATYSDNADLTLYAEWTYVEYAIGNTGPAGGVIFYDDEADGTDDIAGARYLEAWTSDESGTHEWKTTNTATTATSTALGSGYENTYSAMTGDEYPAAEVVRNATHGGYTDWFLPSKDTLNEMRGSEGTIGGFASANYWSSSQRDDNFEFAWGQLFPSGSQFATNKDNALRVRAARRF